jgi:hypothetical protein
MKPALKKQLGAFGLEMLVYAGLIVGYLFLVLHFFGGELHRLFLHDRTLYAWMALLAVVAQGFLLEALTRVLLRFIKPQGGGVE